MNDFDYLGDHKEHRIDGITVNDSGVKIKYATTNAEGKVTKYGENSPEVAHEDLFGLMTQMNAWVQKYFVTKADSEVTNEWADKVSTREIIFKHNSKGVTAQVKGIYRGTDGQAGELKTPATPLYDDTIEGHEVGAIETFGLIHTPTLLAIMDEARMFLGGKRGAMQTQLTEEYNENDSEHFDGIDED